MKVFNERASVQYIGTSKGRADVKLLPGLNVIPDADWEDAKKQKLGIKGPQGKRTVSVVDALIEAGDIRIVRGESDAGSSGNESLKDMPEAEAKRLARETYDLPTLQRLLASESRESVKKELQDQINQINKPPSDEELANRGTAPSDKGVSYDESKETATLPKPATYAPTGNKGSSSKK